MSTTEIAPTQKKSLKDFFSQEVVTNRFREVLGKNSASFVASVLQIAASNNQLSTADPMSIYNAALVAATLNLPINNNLGFAYIVPYKGQAQFQMGYKGFIQLAQRSGQFKTLASTPVYEGQLIDNNPLTGFTFDFSKKDSDKVIGYAAYFELLNGFSKTLFMSLDDINKHGLKYSQTFKKGFGLWKDDFDSMATKTVLKLLLSKFAPLSVEMQMAQISDQGVIKSVDGAQIEAEYVDHQVVPDEITIEELQLLLDMKKEFMPTQDVIVCERVIKQAEKMSYKKIKNLLMQY